MTIKVQIIKETCLSLGKVMVLKTIIIPKLVYLVKVLPSPNINFFAEMERILLEFHLGGKKAKNYYFPGRKRYCRRGTEINKSECVKQGLHLDSKDYEIGWALFEMKQ